MSEKPKISEKLEALFRESGRLRRAAVNYDLSGSQAERLRFVEAEIDRLEAIEMAPDFARLEAIVQRLERVAEKVTRVVEKMEE